ncbi:MAG: VOC family protein [Novosphingobium sp.]
MILAIAALVPAAGQARSAPPANASTVPPPMAAGAPAATESESAAPQLDLLGPGLLTNDLDRALRFYQEGLGLSVLHRLDLPGVTEVMLGFGTRREPPLLMLVKPKDSPPDRGTASGDKFVLTTNDAAAVAKRLQAAGYEPGPVKGGSAGGVRTFWVTDPDGHRLEIIQRAAH